MQEGRRRKEEENVLHLTKYEYYCTTIFMRIFCFSSMGVNGSEQCI